MIKKWLKGIFWPTADPDFVGLALTAVFIGLGSVFVLLYALSGYTLATAVAMMFIMLMLRYYLASLLLRARKRPQSDTFSHLLAHLQQRLYGRNQVFLETPDGAILTLFTEANSVAGFATTSTYRIFEIHDQDDMYYYYRAIVVTSRYKLVQVYEDASTTCYGADGRLILTSLPLPPLPPAGTPERQFILEHSCMDPDDQRILLRRLEESWESTGPST